MSQHLAVLNGHIWTASEEGTVEAFLVEDGRVIALGSEAHVLRKASVGGRRLDLQGQWVIPGLIDAHCHLVHQGLLRSRIDLAEVPDRAQVLERVRRAARRHRGRRPLLAERWDESRWRDRRWPTREELDGITTAFPLIMRRTDGHVAVANTAAVRALEGRLPGVDVERGLLVEDASLHLNRVWPTPAGATAKAAYAATRMALGLGLTAVHDFVTPAYAQAYRSLRSRGRLRLRVTATPYAGPETQRASQRSASPWLRPGGVKIFADGSLGAGTAALREPYSEGEGRGGLLFSDRQLTLLVRQAVRTGRQPCIHAIGDRAIDQVLRVYGRLSARSRRRLRPRIEHAELLLPEHIEQVRDLGVVLSMQPNFLGPWTGKGGLYKRRLGSRAALSNPFARILAAGIPLAFGTDGMPLDPWVGLARAVTASNLQQRLSVEQALTAYTQGSSYAQHQEEELGSLALGHRADFLILRSRPTRNALLKSQLLATYVDGRKAFQATPYAPR